jgi:hypothetical protein
MFKKLFKKIYNSHEINPEDIFLDSSNLSSLEVEKLEGSIDKPISTFSSNFIFVFIVLIFIIFTFQLYILQIKNHEYYLGKSNNNRLNSTVIFASRGQIFDRNNVPLAFNLSASTTGEVLKRKYIKEEGFSNLLGYINYPKADSTGHY